MIPQCRLYGSATIPGAITMAKRLRTDGGIKDLYGTSPATRFNSLIIKMLTRALLADASVDLLTIFPTEYSTRLARMKNYQDASTRLAIMKNPEGEADLTTANDTGVQTIAPGHHKDESVSVHIDFPLSNSVQDLLQFDQHESSQSPSMVFHLRKAIQKGHIIWQSETAQNHAVVKCNSSIVVKIIPGLEDHTEYTTMQYLMKHAPDIPAPRPLGMITSEATSYIFMSFIPGIALDKIWSLLSETQKRLISDQLNELLLKLRTLQKPDLLPLGGVGGEGCKDTRRHTRSCRKVIATVAGFEDFIFSHPHFGGSVYIQVLRRLASSLPSTVVFSHGDIRPANIVVQAINDDQYAITGILDWEKSGFYPDYFESLKATSNMSTMETDDWYLRLPRCSAPGTFPLRWLADRLWGNDVA